MSRKKVIITAHNYYSAEIQGGAHHYARAFAKLGYDVAFLSAPLQPLHKFSKCKTEIKAREAVYKNGGVQDGNIWYYIPKALLTPSNRRLLSSPFVLDNWHRFTYPNIIKKLKQKGFGKVDVIWFDNHIYEFLLNDIEHDSSVFRIPDYVNDFFEQNSMKKYFRTANKCDKIMYTAQKIKEIYKAEITDINKMVYVPNGVCPELFKNDNEEFPSEFENIPEPRILYVGAIAEWFDIELISNCAKTLPDCSFVIIGPPQIDLSKLEEQKNVYILGKKPYATISNFMIHSQVGMIPFKITDIVNCINPLKLYEYMLCGLPVVSTKWDALVDLQTPAFLAETQDEFINNIKLALAEKDKDKYINYAKQQNWDNKLKLMLDNL